MDDFTLYIVGAGSTPATTKGGKSKGGGEVAKMPGSKTELQSIRDWFLPTAKEVPADRLIESFEKTQKAINAMLERVEKDKRPGFALDEFEVSLAVSGEGTIGLVTATAEAGITLKFKRREAPPPAKS